MHIYPVLMNPDISSLENSVDSDQLIGSHTVFHSASDYIVMKGIM